MKPGGDSADRRLRQGVRERIDQQVASAPIVRTHPAQVSVELTTREEVRERVLLDSRRSTIGEVLDVGHRVEQVPWHDEPAKPQRRRERLADRARVDDPIWL